MSGINLTELDAARAKMTPGQWTVSESPKRWVDITAPQDEIAANRVGDAAGLVATHNAADALIEVALAALSAVAVLESLAAEDVTFDSGSSRYVVQMIPAMEVRAIALALAASLAKVSL